MANSVTRVSRYQTMSALILSVELLIAQFPEECFG